MIHDESDLDALARTLWGEARGEPRAGRIAVAWVIRNRAQRTNLPFFAGPLLGRAGAVHRVCHAPWQFSCWNEGDPNRAQILTLTPAQLAGERALAIEVLEAEGTGEASSDPTQGADHYHTVARPVWATEWPPRWARDYRQTARVEHHVFYDSRSSAWDQTSASGTERSLGDSLRLRSGPALRCGTCRPPSPPSEARRRRT